MAGSGVGAVLGAVVRKALHLGLVLVLGGDPHIALMSLPCGRDNRREALTRLAREVSLILVLALAPGLELAALPGHAPLAGLVVLLLVASPITAGDKGKFTLIRVPVKSSM